MRRLPLRTMGALVLALTVFATTASAQWAWKEDGGRVVYSDRPPPAAIKKEQILRQPREAAPAQREAQAGASADAAARPGETKGGEARTDAPKTLAEREMDFRKRQQERDAAQKKAADEQQKSADKAAECERARGYLKALEEGHRITRTDKAGNREFLDDSQRAAETERARKLVQTNCG